VQAANNLVLYTNVNKITAFYRLFGQIRQGKKRIPPRVKRMAIFIHLFSKVYFDRLKKDAFNFVK
jgi:hypothetical protein